MNKVKFLYIVIVLLAFTNIGLILNMYLHKPPHPGNIEGPKKIIVEKLGFNQKQSDAYDLIIKQHRTSIESIESKIRKNKDALFTVLMSEDSDKKDSIITNLGGLQMEIEAAHYKHFEAIKSICKKDQMQQFDELTNELGGLFAPGPPKKK